MYQVNLQTFRYARKCSYCGLEYETQVLCARSFRMTNLEAGTMKGLITIIALFVIWGLLQKVILPRLGVST